MFLDIHSHILHNVDDGAKDLNTSIALLQSAYEQGVTDVILTPHFYAQIHSLEECKEETEIRFEELKNAIKGKAMPNIFLGNELFYFKGISRASTLEPFTLNDSRYLLFEPDRSLLNKAFMEEILHLKERGYIPIIPHIERYSKEKGYKAFVKFVKANGILTQVNATSFFSKYYNRPLRKLFKSNLVTFLGSDAHSLETRPVLIKGALEKIASLYGEDTKQKLIDNSEWLLSQITKKELEV